MPIFFFIWFAGFAVYMVLLFWFSFQNDHKFDLLKEKTVLNKSVSTGKSGSVDENLMEFYFKYWFGLGFFYNAWNGSDNTCTSDKRNVFLNLFLLNNL